MSPMVHSASLLLCVLGLCVCQRSSCSLIDEESDDLCLLQNAQDSKLYVAIGERGHRRHSPETSKKAVLLHQWKALAVDEVAIRDEKTHSTQTLELAIGDRGHRQVDVTARKHSPETSEKAVLLHQSTSLTVDGVVTRDEKTHSTQTLNRDIIIVLILGVIFLLISIGCFFLHGGSVQRSKDTLGALLADVGMDRDQEWKVSRAILDDAYNKFPGDAAKGIPPGKTAFEFFNIIRADGKLLTVHGGIETKLTIESLVDEAENHKQWWMLVLDPDGGCKLATMCKDSIDARFLHFSDRLDWVNTPVDATTVKLRTDYVMSDAGKAILKMQTGWNGDRSAR